MPDKNPFQKRASSLFYIAFALYIIPRYLQYTTLWDIGWAATGLSVLKLLSYPLFLVLCLYRIKETIKPLSTAAHIVVAAFGVFLVYQVIANNSRDILSLLLISLAFYHALGFQKLEQFLRFCFHLQLSLFCTTILLCLTGIIPDATTASEKLGGTLIRYSLGFNYPGQLQMNMTALVMLYYYLYRKQISLIRNLIAVALCTAVLAVSRTVMPYGVALLCIVLVSAEEKYHFVSRLPRRLLYAVPAICAGIAVLFVWLEYWDNPIGVLVDTFANHRFYLANDAIRLFGIRLLGTGFQNTFVSSEGFYLFVDSEYLFMLISNGILYTLALLAMFTAISRYALRKDTALWVIFFLQFCSAIMNNCLVNLVASPFSIITICALKDGFQYGKQKH